MIDDKAIDRLRDAGAGAELALAEIPAGRLDLLDEHLAAALTMVRDAAAGCAADFRSTAKASEDEPERVAARRAALAAIGEVGDAAERMLEAFEPPIAERADVVWMDRPAGEESNRPPTLRVAPLRVGGLLASRLFGRRTTVLTSATLVLGGSFEPLARQWGLAGAPEVPEKAPPAPTAGPLARPLACQRPDPRMTARTRIRPGTGPRQALGRGRARAGSAKATSHGTRWPGRAWTSARRSTTRAAASCTSPGTCRRPGATAWPRPTWTRSAS